MRVIEKGEDGFEYGCRFLELTEADQSRLHKTFLWRKENGTVLII